MKSRRYLIVIAVVGICISVVTGLYLSASAYIQHKMTVRVRTTFALPDGIHELEHSRICIHMMPAEHSRDVTFITNGKRGRTTPLAIDTCGGYPINCYYIDAPGGGFLRMDDAVSEHLLDLKASKTYLIIRVQGTAYVGEMTDENTSSGWSASDDNPTSMSVTINDKPAVPMATLIHNAAERYIGRLDGRRFISASESPAIAIDHLYER